MVINRNSLKSVIGFLTRKGIGEENILEISSEVILENTDKDIDKIEIKVGENEEIVITK